MSQSITLYRYLSHEAALRSIEGRQFRVGRIKEFNDPFEWRMGLKGYKECSEAEVISDTCMNAFIEEMNSTFGILCFSDIVTDPVLWAHYADNHTGVAFELDHLIDPRLHKVDYTDDRPVLDINDLECRSVVEPLLNKMIKQKASSWAYEREYRVHIELDKCDVAGGHYFQAIPDNLVTKVILGNRCPLDGLYVRKALDDVGLDTADVVRATMDQQTYTIKC